MTSMKCLSTSDLHCVRAQRGSALLEVALAVAVTGALLVGGMQYWSQQLRSDTARVLAGQYKLVNAAVASYMTVNWTVLVGGTMPANCDAGSVFSGSGESAAPSNNCSADVKGNDGTVFQIRHALQPTIGDLQSLNFLPRTVNGRPVLPDDPNVVTLSRHSGAWVEAPHSFAIHIQRVCTNQANPDPSTCVDANRDLRSLVFNQRPYRTIDGGWPMLNEAMLAMGNDGLVSMPGVGGVDRNIVGIRGDTTLPNPIGGAAPNSPPFGVLAIRNGFGSSGWGQFTRRDGSALPTDHWNFNNKTLHNVEMLLTKTVYATERFKLPVKDYGSTCDPTFESIALYSHNSKKLMYCDGGSDGGRWTMDVRKTIDMKQYQDFEIANRYRFNTGLKVTEWLPTLQHLYTGRDGRDQAIPSTQYLLDVDGYWTITHSNVGARTDVEDYGAVTFRFYRIVEE